MDMMTLEQFEALARRRRATRHFLSDPLPEGILGQLLDTAHWAPSGYNLQPTHFVVVTDPAIKQKLLKACMDQKQVTEAPAIVIFTGDRNVVANNFDRILASDLDAGCINQDYERLLRKVVPLAFGHGPAGAGWLWKAALVPFVQRFIPIPSIPAVHKRYWLTKQVLLSAMAFMLAAESAGLATVPMEGFDEWRVKRLLNIPRSHIVPIVIPVGYAADAHLSKTRLPLEGMVHYNGW